MNNIDVVRNTFSHVLGSDVEWDTSTLDALTSIFIVERWDARHGKHSAYVNMDYTDICDFDMWLDLNMPMYKKLKTAVEDIEEMFPGMPKNYIVEKMYNYF